MKSFFIILICVISGLSSSSQSLKGKVLYADTRKPVAAANVFLANTSVGTITKENGEFIITNFPAGRYDLVVSFIGYESFTMSVISNRLPETIEVLLKPKVTELQEVILEPYEKDGWAKWGTFFIENFIGTSAEAADCKLLNKDVLKFRHNKKTNVLKVTADDRLEIENKALGYHLKYDLTLFEFNFNTRIFIYQGYPLFLDMETKRSGQRKKWLANREDAYYGSLMHFMRSLYRNKLIEQEFEVRRMIKISDAEKARVNRVYRARLNTQLGSDGRTMIVGDAYKGLNPDTAAYYKKVMREPESLNVLIDKILPGDSIAFAIDSTVAGLNFKDYLYVVYKPKIAPLEYYKTIRQPYMKAPLTSDLHRTSDEPIMIWSNGNYHEGTTIITSGFWSFSEKVAALLPSDYWPPPKTKSGTFFAK